MKGKIKRRIGLLPALLLNASIAIASSPSDRRPLYEPRGVGGGGAMAGYSISPFSRLRFVGTDMGTLFRSIDDGRSWTPVDQGQAPFSSDLARAAPLGFSADGETVLHAPGGRDPRRSLDRGVRWKPVKMPLKADERILYWASDRWDPETLFCGTTLGLLRTTDKGLSWHRVDGVDGPSRGTVVLSWKGRRVALHAVPDGILLAKSPKGPFEAWHLPIGHRIRALAGGADSEGLTLALLDDQGKQACAWAKGDRATQEDCGFVWIARQDDFDRPAFRRTAKDGGRYLRMAENDSKTIYVTGGNWMRQYGTKVWVSSDRGESWKLALHLYDWDRSPYRPWPKDRLEHSAVGLDVGWDDNAYTSFAVNPLDSADAGGTGYYFLHTTADAGKTWQAPFTRYADTGPRDRRKRWSSTGLEVTSALRLKFHPKSPLTGYAAFADIGGLATEDGGRTWRICRDQYNTHYDYAFDPAEPARVYAASGSLHDFPLNQRSATQGAGGIFVSNDRGRSWKRLTPDGREWNRQFLSVAYDHRRGILYGGTQGAGIARSLDGGRHWQFHNPGLPGGARIVPQLETDPETGDVYALLTGNAPGFEQHRSTGIYFLAASAKAASWQLLRGRVSRPDGVDPKHPLWLFPSAFAVDFSRPSRDVLWLADLESKGAWMSSGVWKSVDRGKTWARSTQFTHPTSLALDPSRPGTVYASGLYQLDGSWGLGGALWSPDGGATWKKNESVPLKSNLFASTPDPNSSNDIFYLFFGGGIYHGPKPR